MYKISLSAMILLGLGACATPVSQTASQDLLSFTDLAAEISVEHEVISINSAFPADTSSDSVD